MGSILVAAGKYSFGQKRRRQMRLGRNWEKGVAARRVPEPGVVYNGRCIATCENCAFL